MVISVGKKDCLNAPNNPCKLFRMHASISSKGVNLLHYSKKIRNLTVAHCHTNGNELENKNAEWTLKSWNSRAFFRRYNQGCVSSKEHLFLLSLQIIKFEVHLTMFSCLADWFIFTILISTSLYGKSNLQENLPLDKLALKVYEISLSFDLIFFHPAFQAVTHHTEFI